MGAWALWAAWAVWAVWARAVHGHGQCGVWQWACRSAGCVRADQYCDGIPHCADGSDEAAHCTPCNRTYYGRAGDVYSLTLGGSPRLPFLCQLTFTAGGHQLGDLVQLTFDEFRVGRYMAGASEPCPDGYLTLAELGRPFTGGAWCGTATGPAAYYSETSTLTASLKLSRARLGEPLALRLRYRFLSSREAVVRYGPVAAPLERGAVSPGTYCTRTFEECHRKRCRLQSPNYPGMYPRNVSCYWSLRQKDVPTCKHAMLSVRQEHAHKMQIKRSIAPASMNKTGRVVRAWSQCSTERDRLIVYDGGSTDDPVLLEYCGGDWLPAVTARGADMLVAFHASSRPAPPAPAPRAALRGFELDVDVIFADSDSLDYAREARRCEFHVKASSASEELNVTLPAGGGAGVGAGRGRRGVLKAPTHTLPPQTTCTWTFHGRPGDLVWIYFSSFSSYSLMEPRRVESSDEDMSPPRPAAPPPRADCAVELRLWEGEAAPHPASEVWCDAAPALCARAALANATRAPRPCAPPDGRVSAGPLLALSVRSRPGTAIHPLSFALHYEFVDARLDGEVWTDERAFPAECARLVTRPGLLHSPRNVLWFGRGGAPRLRCVWRLQGAQGTYTQLTLRDGAFGRTERCVTRPHPLTGRPACYQLPATDEQASLTPWDDMESLSVPHVRVYEAPWGALGRVLLGCVCDGAGAAGWGARGAGLEVELAAERLSATEDHRHVHFTAMWEETGPHHCTHRRRLHTPQEHLHLQYPYSSDSESECGETPFVVTARGNRSLLVRVWGTELVQPPGTDAPTCHTANRLLIYDAHTSRLVKAVCPGGDNEVQLVWPEWGAVGAGAALAVVWVGREAGTVHAAVMEVWRTAGTNATAGCSAVCAALDACMPAGLWCDGRVDCPGGGDEHAGCGARARLLALVRAHGGAAGGVAGGAAALLLALVLLALRRRGRRRKAARVDDLLASRASSAAS